ncbi:MAG TPA: iron-sulfur cluster assembly scaffold protein [Armatimonadota bacterium]|nr:iron-sulfur cluster assembly scaffold protein [Armatimonadota bacterium]
MLTKSQPTYNPTILDHYQKPRNVGSLDLTDANVVSGLAEEEGRSDVVRLHFKIDPATRRINDVRFKAFGCPTVIAAASLTTELLKGRTLEEAAGINSGIIAGALSLPDDRLHSAELVERAIQLAVRAYENRSSDEKPGL